MKEQNETQQSIQKTIPWYTNLKWYHTLLLSFVLLTLFFITNIALFDWAFLIGFIFSTVQMVKAIKNKKN